MIMSENNNEYKIHSYNNYSSNLNQIINDENIDNKIYILDIDFESKNGIDIAREIRDNDFNSIIIFYTSHENIYSILKVPLIFDCITKFESENLEKTLKKALQYIKKDTLYLNKGQTIYKIKYDDILYITTNLENRGITIVTTNKKINIKISMNDISKMLNRNFIRTHRACFVNKNRIFKIDFKNREIIFDNNVKTNLVSVREVKKLKEKI